LVWEAMMGALDTLQDMLPTGARHASRLCLLASDAQALVQASNRLSSTTERR
jgi:hypothetical protein